MAYQELAIRPSNFGPGGNCRINEDGSGLTFEVIELAEPPFTSYIVNRTIFYRPFGYDRLTKRLGLHYVITPHEEAMLALTQDYEVLKQQYKAQLLTLVPPAHTRFIQATIASLGPEAREAFRSYLDN